MLSRKQQAPRSTAGSNLSNQRIAPVLSDLVAGLGKLAPNFRQNSGKGKLMDKIWIITSEQIASFKDVAKSVYNRDFKARNISTDDIACTDSHREDFVSKCSDELKIRTLSDELVSALLTARKASEL